VRGREYGAILHIHVNVRMKGERLDEKGENNVGPLSELIKMDPVGEKRGPSRGRGKKYKTGPLEREK